MTYTFQYDGCGALTKITYPSGGYTRYIYDEQHYMHLGSANGLASPSVTDVEVIGKYVCRAPAVSPGALSTGPGNTCPVAEDFTSYTPTINGNTDTNNEQVSVVDPLGNLTKYQFTQSGIGTNPPPPVETSRSVYQGSSTLLRTINTSYTSTLPKVPTVETTILNNGLQTQAQWDYWGFDFVKKKREYAWSSNGTFSLVRRTDYGSYCDDKPSSETVYDGSGSQLANTVYEMDNYTAGISSSGAVQHDPNYNANLRGRCNVTAVQRWRNTDGAMLTTRMQYDDAGNVLSTTDPLSHQTTTSYADVWGNTTCLPSGGNAAAYPTQVTDPAGLITKHSFNSCTGTVASSTDPNSQQATFSYDLMDRLVQSNLPNGGQTSACFSEVSGSSCYSSSYPLKMVSTQKVTSTVSKTSTVVLDGLARVSQTQLNSDPEGVTYVDTTYDAAEQKSTVSNPYRTTSDVTYGITTYNYDALGRVTKVIPPDGTSTSNNVATTYDIANGATNCTSVTDQAGKARKSCSDAQGRLVQVFEDPSSLNYETDYQYDWLNNLLRVDQKGSAPGTSSQWRTRTFAYNSLSQLLCAANPEITPTGGTLATCPNPDNGAYTPGTVRYAYDNDGNLITKTSPKPNQTSSSVTVVTTYTYNDPDNRLTKKSYNDGVTSTVQFAYDGGTLSGCTRTPPTLTDSYPKGRRTSMCDGSGAASWNHDMMGRTLTESRNVNSYTRNIAYGYNLDGSLATLTYPSGRVITYAYAPGSSSNSAGRQISANDSTGINYAAAALYAPFGGLSDMTQGATPITIKNRYSLRLQPVLSSAFTTSATIMSLCHDFHLGVAVSSSNFGPCSFSASSLGDNGNVYQIVNNRDSNRTQNFMYDSLNRIQQAYTSGPNWGETYSSTATAPGVVPPTSGIDAWGNLTNHTGVTGKTNTEGTLACPANANNQLTTCSLNYDAAGNVTANGTASYTYDAENHITSAGGGTYLYDGDGQRMAKVFTSSGTNYWRDLGGNTLLEDSNTGVDLREYIYFNGQRVARRDVRTNTVHYVFSNHLESTSIITDALGTMAACNGYTSGQFESDYYPYGGEISICNNLGDQNYKFTGKERDAETGLDNFGARFDASSFGRFMSVDNGKIHIANPQTFNRYILTLNNPLRFVDPDGNDPIDSQLEKHLLHFNSWAGSVAERMVGELETGQGSRSAIAANGRIATDLHNEHVYGIGEFDEAAASRIRAGAHQDLLDMEIHGLADNLLSKLRAWANLDSTTVSQLKSVDSDIRRADDKRSTKKVKDTADNIGKIGDAIGEIPDPRAKAAGEAISHAAGAAGAAADIAEGEQYFITRQAEDILGDAIDKTTAQCSSSTSKTNAASDGTTQKCQ